MPKKDLENTEAVAETVETTDPMKQMVRIKLPKDRENKQPDLFVGLNGKTYLIKRGEAVEVPLLGVRKVSGLSTVRLSGESPVVSAVICSTTVASPCPMHAAEVLM